MAITPEEKQLIEKIPTTDLTAYDFYQRGREQPLTFMNVNYIITPETFGAVKKAEDYYKKAIEYDSTFALAYTGLALVYIEKHNYSTSTYFTENYLDSTIIFADKALSFDDKLAEAYDVRGVYYGLKGLTKKAIEEYDKALKYNPNDWMAYIGKGDLYLDCDLVQAIINYQKAESLIRDSNQLPLLLRKIGIAFYFAGFNDKAKYYILEASKLDEDSIQLYLYSTIIEPYQGYFENGFEYLLKAYKIDSTNITIIKELGFYNLCVGKYDESLTYYKKYIEKLKDRGQLPINESHRIGHSFWENGYKKEANYYFDKQIEYCNNDIKYGGQYATGKYAYYDLAGVYAFRGDRRKAYENLRIFKQKEAPSKIADFIKIDPLFDSIRDDLEFQQIVRDLEAKYQAEHERVKKWLEEQGMLKEGQ